MQEKIAPCHTASGRRDSYIWIMNYLTVNILDWYTVHLQGNKKDKDKISLKIGKIGLLWQFCRWLFLFSQAKKTRKRLFKKKGSAQQKRSTSMVFKLFKRFLNIFIFLVVCIRFTNPAAVDLPVAFLLFIILFISSI